MVPKYYSLKAQYVGIVKEHIPFETNKLILDIIDLIINKNIDKVQFLCC